MEVIVTPAYLRSKASVLEERFHEAEENCKRIIQISEETQPYLSSKCGDILRERISERQKELEMKIAILEKTFLELYALADEYDRAEKENVNGAVRNRSTI